MLKICVRTTKLSPEISLLNFGLVGSNIGDIEACGSGLRLQNCDMVEEIVASLITTRGFCGGRCQSYKRTLKGLI